MSILETAADKFVGLTRRAGAELAGLDEPDPTLVRHLHDLHALREHYDPAEVAALAREVMLADAEAYGNQFPAYREDPMRETLRAVEGPRGRSRLCPAVWGISAVDGIWRKRRLFRLHQDAQKLGWSDEFMTPEDRIWEMGCGERDGIALGFAM